MVTSTSRWYALAALALSTLAIGLDTTILSVALPTLSRDLHATTGDLQWFTNAYLLVLGAASAACAWAASTGELIAARTVLGLGAAVLMPLSGAVLTVLFDDKD